MHYEQLDEVWRELTEPGAPFELDQVGGERVFRNAPPHLAELWASTRAFAGRDYLVYEGERITYAEAHDQVDAVASWLANQGVVSGDRVGIANPTRHELRLDRHHVPLCSRRASS